MRITYLEQIDSTQIYLKKQLQAKNIQPPYAVVANIQTNGIGSRDNNWQGLRGNLFLSFALSLKSLPKDLKLESCSLYYAYLLKEILNDLNSDIWLKWPNDFYLNNLKVGGIITNIVDKTLVCGVGINLAEAPKEFASLDIKISREVLLKKYFKLIEKNVSWKQIFRKYKIEFEDSRKFFTHKSNLKIPLGNAILEDDGSISITGERIYSRR